MGKKIIRRKIYPELYVHLVLKRKLTENEESDIRQAISTAAEHAFWESFGIPAWAGLDNRNFTIERRLRGTEKLTKTSVRDQVPEDYKMVVVLEEGSLKIKIVTGLSALYLAIGGWGDFVSGSSDIAARLRWTYDHLLPVVHQIVGEPNIQEEIRHERRIGAVGRFDELIKEYQKGEISETDFLDEGNALLQHLAQSEDREVLLPIVSHYLNQQYGIEVTNQNHQNDNLTTPLQWHDDRPDAPLQPLMFAPAMLLYRRPDQ